MLYNLCHEPRSRKCIKWFGSKVANIAYIFGINFEFYYISTCRNRSPGNWNCPPNLVNHKIAPITHKIAPRWAISPPLSTTDLGHCWHKMCQQNKILYDTFKKMINFWKDTWQQLKPSSCFKRTIGFVNWIYGTKHKTLSLPVVKEIFYKDFYTGSQNDSTGNSR